MSHLLHTSSDHISTTACVSSRLQHVSHQCCELSVRVPPVRFPCAAAAAPMVIATRSLLLCMQHASDRGSGCAATDGWLDVRGLLGGFLAGEGRRAHVRVVAFTDEEGMRFHTTFLGSRALIGAHSPPPPQGRAQAEPAHSAQTPPREGQPAITL